MVGLIQLHCFDQQDAYRLARERFSLLNLDVDKVAEDQFEIEWQYQLVTKMLLIEDAQDPTATLFKDPKECRNELTPNEVSWFIDQHTKLQHKEIEEWIEDPGLPEWAVELTEILGLGHDADGSDIIDAVKNRIATN